MIEVTEKANQAVKKVLEERKLEGALRVFLNSGCGGTSLAMAMDEAKEGDLSLDKDGVTYIIESALDNMAGGVTIDYVDQGYSQGFTITPVNELDMGEGASCGGGCSGCH